MRNEVRSIATKVEKREKEGKKPGVVGYAAVFNVWADLGYFKEKIVPGAFKNAIKERQDVRCLFNHDPNWIYGKTASEPQTLELKEDSHGLWYDCDLGDTEADRYLLDRVERKIVTGSSFGFRVRPGGSVWTYTEPDDTYERQLLDLDLYDVSPVVYPAYTETEVAVRELELFKKTRGNTLPGVAARKLRELQQQLMDASF